jgi:hypothetical protein
MLTVSRQEGEGQTQALPNTNQQHQWEGASRTQAMDTWSRSVEDAMTSRVAPAIHLDNDSYYCTKQSAFLVARQSNSQYTPNSETRACR